MCNETMGISNTDFFFLLTINISVSHVSNPYVKPKTFSPPRISLMSFYITLVFPLTVWGQKTNPQAQALLKSNET